MCVCACVHMYVYLCAGVCIHTYVSSPYFLRKDLSLNLSTKICWSDSFWDSDVSAFPVVVLLSCASTPILACAYILFELRSRFKLMSSGFATSILPIEFSPYTHV